MLREALNWGLSVNRQDYRTRLTVGCGCKKLSIFCYSFAGAFHVSPSGLMSANVHPLITSINASGNSARS